MDTKILSIRFPLEVYTKLKQKAKEEERSINKQVLKFLVEGLGK